MERPSCGPRRILIVDDEPDVRASLRRMLESAGYQVDEAANGKEAMIVCRSRPVDLIFMDIFMPEQEGMETIRRVRCEFPATKIIAISGKATEVYFRTAKLLGADGTLEKPLRLETVLEAVRQVLEEPPAKS